METATIDEVTVQPRHITSIQQTIGLFGFGTVGRGLYQVLESSPTTRAKIKQVCIKNPEKERGIGAKLFTTDANLILNDPEINLVVELIDNADEAYQIVKAALERGKSVVSGNKTMLAHHLEELILLQKKTGAALLYDASACGSIPVIRNLEEYYDNDLLLSIQGILNGSTNFILTRIFQHGESYASALQKAQELGFAESNPIFDVEGFDALYKLIILAVHGFGTYVHPKKAFHCGISHLTDFDIQYAKEKGRKIKLVAKLTKLNATNFTLYVMPRLVTPDEYIYNVEEEYNGVVIEGAFYEKQFMFGKGAGGFPTGSAVLSDITARFHDYRYEYKKQKYFEPPLFTNEVLVEVYLRYQNLLDLSLFEFEEISEKYSGKQHSWIVGTIKLANLQKLQELLPRLDVFLATTGKTEYLK
ncbi:MAG TPA: homoserine dehydrogenase [Williamwhitmania sp.]|nr:homoserine dehydrogenase [Williamwhitmania sp.]